MHKVNDKYVKWNSCNSLESYPLLLNSKAGNVQLGWLPDPCTVTLILPCQQREGWMSES